ncbi:helix-turn-helix transcriptional regulator [Romboutsia sp.]|uniref:helix-turn-helix transcriptional regulator n=1 Tax=Romboutsia sp. TaxID=1965302 RepID=UPI002BDEFCBB|nr:helix-turn-helix domain-containing protein [Romboutsia sp.]HSQ87559.1 helix-turn-helix domain-containing protein [Romboutsia sp.]
MRVKLKNLRREKQLTQEEIAKQIGITRAYYTNLEQGRGNPSLKLASRIKEILSYEKDDIFLEEI